MQRKLKPSNTRFRPGIDIMIQQGRVMLKSTGKTSSHTKLRISLFVTFAAALRFRTVIALPNLHQRTLKISLKKLNILGVLLNTV